jgi:hypothetical protein
MEEKARQIIVVTTPDSWASTITIAMKHRCLSVNILWPEHKERQLMVAMVKWVMRCVGIYMERA